VTIKPQPRLESACSAIRIRLVPPWLWQAVQEELNEKKRATAQTVAKIFSHDEVAPADTESHGFGKHKKYERLQKAREKERKNQHGAKAKGGNARMVLMMSGMSSFVSAPSGGHPKDA
jgi:hypothetical protein